MMQSNFQVTSQLNDEQQKCPAGKYWVKPHTRKKVTKAGHEYIENAKFIAPNITIACATHEYRIENLNPHQPPDYYNNIPLLVDPKRDIYICYDENNLIQTYPFPKQPRIQPPKGYFATNYFVHFLFR